MAFFYVRLCDVREKAVASAPIGKQTITTSGTSQTSTVIAPLEAVSGGLLWRVEAISGDVWVKFGAAPTAAAGDDWRVVDGEIAFFTAEPGETVAVIDAA